MESVGRGDDGAAEEERGMWETSEKRTETEQEEAEPESDDDGEA